MITKNIPIMSTESITHILSSHILVFSNPAWISFFVPNKNLPIFPIYDENVPSLFILILFMPQA